MELDKKEAALEGSVQEQSKRKKVNMKKLAKMMNEFKFDNRNFKVTYSH